MANKQEIQKCIQDCTNAANMLRTTTNSINDARIRDMVTQGAHHVELCIRQCEMCNQMMP